MNLITLQGKRLRMECCVKLCHLCTHHYGASISPASSTPTPHYTLKPIEQEPSQEPLFEGDLKGTLRDPLRDPFRERWPGGR